GLPLAAFALDQPQPLSRALARGRAGGPPLCEDAVPFDARCARSRRDRRGGRPAEIAGRFGRLLLSLFGVEEALLRSGRSAASGPRNGPLAVGQGVGNA